MAQAPETTRRASRKGAAAFSLLMIAAVLSPAARNWKEKPQDSFPLSHYPMFSAKRSSTARVTYLVGIDAQGNRHKIPYSYAGPAGLNQVRKQIAKLVRAGDAPRLCSAVASKLASRDAGFRPAILTVQVSTGRYVLNDYFSDGKRDPDSEEIHASCPVPSEPSRSRAK